MHFGHLIQQEGPAVRLLLAQDHVRMDPFSKERKPSPKKRFQPEMIIGGGEPIYLPAFGPAALRISPPNASLMGT
jgi:hypothetical protein